VVCAWEYEGPPRALILNLKLRGDRAAAGPLVEGVLAAARRSGLAGETVTWVPGRPAGIRERGFDHAALLAAGVARELGLPACSLLRRRRAVSDQSELSAADRRINLENAFAAEACTGGIVLVDDLLTTGSTAEACARALREAGAAFVELLAPCRRS
jgi:predicted amidophosphoribosyltransferase